ncbi:MAG: phenylalanine--tRNA ligase subunit alpha, partial [Alphaproteobacteria bacterium]|nr:phenylalanine--tRNA ligase subunit alpha [Alphaproteobacteria bacterium]
MLPDLDQLEERYLAQITASDNLDGLDAIRVDALGKKGNISTAMKNLGQLDGDARREAGQALNALKTKIADAIDAKKVELARAALDARLVAEKVDVTLSPRPEAEGRIHPLSRTLEEVTAIFAEMGFSVAEGPDIESDFYNFTALNIP